MIRVRALVLGFLAMAGCTPDTTDWPAWSAKGLSLVVPNDAKVSAGTPVRVLVMTSAPAGKVAVLQAEGVPVGATFGDRGDGTAFFFWTPTTAQVGKHAVRVMAAAGAELRRSTFTLTVVAAAPGAQGEPPADPDAPGEPPQDPPAGPVNAAPSLQSAVLASATFTKASPLTVVPAGWHDAEGATPAYIVRWYVSGLAVTAEANLALQPDYFVRGDTVAAEVYPLDGSRIGAPVTTPTVAIEDGRPSIAAVELLGAPYTAAGVLEASATGWFDVDGDAPALAYRWFVDGYPIGVTARTLGDGWFAKGMTVSVEVTPRSGTRFGSPRRSAVVSIANAPPRPPRVRLRAQGVKWNSTLLTLDTLSAAVDADGDAVQLAYAWYLNGVLFAQGTSRPTVTQRLVHGDVWEARVVAGDGEQTGPVTSATLALDLRRVKGLALGANHTCALLNEGFVKCWGSNALGQLGHNLGVGSYATPQLVMNQGDDVAQIATQKDHTCAVTLDGVVHCWGSNTGGQVGTGVRGGTYDTPQAVAGLPVPARMVATGGAHTCALGIDGGLHCWGDNTAGQLGIGASTEATTPTRVPGLALPVSAVTAGAAHTCALAISGVVQCWGSNGSGQLGAGLAAAQSDSPVTVGTPAGMVELRAGGAHTCARSAAGRLWCWGSNGAGQLGNGNASVATSNVPLAVAGADSYAQITLGSQHTCGALQNGNFLCWGASAAHQLGTGTASSGSTPTPQLVNAVFGASGLGAGGAHTCVLTRGGAVKCWGDRTYGQVGDGVIGAAQPLAAGVSGLSAVGVAGVATGGEHTCALSVGGAVKCWGRGDSGQLGHGVMAHAAFPVDVVGLQSGVAQIDAGDLFTCARLAAGGVKCWGANQYASLGNGTVVGSATPVSLAMTPLNAKRISLGNTHGCLVTTGNAAYCWGNPLDGSTAYAPQGLGGTLYDVAAGGRHTCALRYSQYGGGVVCRGRNNFGQLGDGTQTDNLSWVEASLGTWDELALGYDHSCARTAGNAHCWGNGWAGATGQGTFNVRTWPSVVYATQWVALAGVLQVVSGLARSCAITTAGLTCWGAAYLGDGTALDRNLAVVVGAGVAVAISKGAAFSGTRGHICSVDRRQALLCWGQNGFGQVGRPGLAYDSPGEAFLSSYWW